MRRYGFLALIAATLLGSAGCSARAEITAPRLPALPRHTEFALDTVKRGPGALGGGN